MLEKFKNLGKDDSKDGVPSYAWVSLARRGMEKISLDQCFLEGCDNEDIKLLDVIKKEEQDNNDSNLKFLHMKCKKCGGIFQIKLETIKRVAKPTKIDKDKEEVEEALSMGMIHILDKDGKNLGHLGYF